jgi:hypothetical protein
MRTGALSRAAWGGGGGQKGASVDLALSSAPSLDVWDQANGGGGGWGERENCMQHQVIAL